MIISRTPLRISFLGGGTDLPEFYHYESGSVLTTAINKYMYITVNRRFDETIRISYSRTEIASTVDEIEHPIVREALRTVGLDGGLEITSIADVPAGTGLGSSSSFAVGLLNALHAYKGQSVSAEDLAQQACDIEIRRLATPIGKQDQYAAAYGGFQYIRFNRDETVFVDPVIFPEERKRRLRENLLLFYTGMTRSAATVLAAQKRVTLEKFTSLSRMRDLCQPAKLILTNGSDLRHFGALLHEGWILKRGVIAGISTDLYDSWYEAALNAGATGGKLLGAGGGGFVLFYVEPEWQTSVRNRLGNLREVPFDFEPQGSKIIYVAT